MVFNAEKLAKFVRGKTATARTGGKGTVRRKHKAVRKAASHDDKRLKTTLNRLNVRDIPAIEEVNLFKEDGHVIHFVNPKVQASIAANTYVVSGNAENKKLQDLLPGIITQLGPDNLEYLKKMYASFNDKLASKSEDGDEVPELVENFEAISKKELKKEAIAAAAAAAIAGAGAATASATTTTPATPSTAAPSSSSTPVTEEKKRKPRRMPLLPPHPQPQVRMALIPKTARPTRPATPKRSARPARQANMKNLKTISQTKRATKKRTEKH